MRFQSLDSLRGVCAMLVVLYHCQFLTYIKSVSVIQHGWIFVDFFFVLSGFVIAFAYEKRLNSREDLEQFIFRRFGRLYPLHLFMLLAFIAYELVKLYLMSSGSASAESEAFGGEGNSLFAIFTNLLMIHALGMHDTGTWNAPSWSISVEFFTYVTFAIAIMLLRKWKIVAYLLLMITGLGVTVSCSGNFLHTTYDFGFFRCIYGFFLGAMTFKAFEFLKDRMKTLPRACFHIPEILLIALIALFISYIDHSGWTFVAPPVFAICVFVFAFSRGIVSTVLNRAPFTHLGKISYSLYMTHILCMLLIIKFFEIVLKKQIKPVPGGDRSMTYEAGLLVLYVGVIVVVSTITYYLVEDFWRKKANQFAKRFAQKKRTKPVTAE